MQRFEWVVLTDVDGTLEYKGLGIMKETIDSAREYVNCGGGLGLATGRAIVSTRRIAKAMKVNTLSILYGGAMVYDFINHQICWKCPLIKSIKLVVEDILIQFKDVCIAVITDTGISIFNPNNIVKEKGVPEESLPNNYNRKIEGEILKLTLCGERERLDQIKNIYFQQSEYNFTYSSRHFVEVVAKKAGKGNALYVLSEMINVPLSRFIVMGDGDNDYEMLKRGGVPFTLENASRRLKDIAKMVLPHCLELGAAKGFELAKLILKNNKN